MATQQYECPKCHSFKNHPASMRFMLRMVSLASAFIGILLLAFLVGIPFLLVSIAAFAGSFFYKDTGERKCQNCHFVFKQAT